MKIAKPSEADLEAAFAFIAIESWLDDMRRGLWPAAWEDEDGDPGPDWFDVQNPEHLRLFFDRACKVARPCATGALNRVVGGMAVVMDPVNRIVDPVASHLALHPRFAAIDDADAVQGGEP